MDFVRNADVTYTTAFVADPKSSAASSCIYHVPRTQLLDAPLLSAAEGPAPTAPSHGGTRLSFPDGNPERRRLIVCVEVTSRVFKLFGKEITMELCCLFLLVRIDKCGKITVGLCTTVHCRNPGVRVGRRL